MTVQLLCQNDDGDDDDEDEDDDEHLFPLCKSSTSSQYYPTGPTGPHLTLGSPPLPNQMFFYTLCKGKK